MLFIIKCRFPSHKSFAEIIRHRYNGKGLSKVRKLEKLDFKLRKCKLDIEFLETCLKNGLMSKFLNFKVANSTLRSSKSYKEYQLKLLRQELFNKKSKCRSENNEFKVLRNEILSILSVVDFTHLITVFTNSNHEILRKVQETRKKKLHNLGFFEHDKECNNPNQVIYAYTSFKKYNFLEELNLSRDEYNTLKNLSSLKNMTIQKSDKGNSVALMNGDDYINRMETLISD